MPDNAYTDEELLRINARHDREQGWSPRLPTVYTNPRRLPETDINYETTMDETKRKLS